MTPWQVGTCIEGYREASNNRHNDAAWLGYHMALLGHMKVGKFPDLHVFMRGDNAAKKPAVKKQSEAAILQQLKAYQKQRDRNGAGSKSSR